MPTTLLRQLICGFITLLLFGMLSIAYAIGETTRVSAKLRGGKFYEGGTTPSISANGRFIAFVSGKNLVADDTNNIDDIYVYDMLNKKHTRVSISSNGRQATDTHSRFSPVHSKNSSPIISADGRFVAFSSDAANLVKRPVDTNGAVYVHDRQTKQTNLVSVDSNGNAGINQYFYLGEALSGGSFPTGISTDGRYVLFVSSANNLVAGDTNTSFDTFIHDRLTRKTTRVSVDTNGKQRNEQSGYDGSTFSGDGRYVAFISLTNDTIPSINLSLYDRLKQQTMLVSNNVSFDVHMSADGNFLAFNSSLPLVADDTNGVVDVYIYNRLTRKISRASITSGGNQVHHESRAVGMSANGRYIAFVSKASSLVTGDTNGIEDIFVHDLLLKQTVRVNVDSNGIQTNTAFFDPELSAKLSADGRYVAFATAASNMVAGDNNGNFDIFVRDRWLDNAHQADLSITVTTQPTSLTTNSQGSFVYTITNNGPDNIQHLQIQYLFSNGKLISLTPGAGTCKHYASINLCNLGALQSGASVTLQTNIEALRPNLTQHVSISSGGRSDLVPANNYLDISTPVKP